MTSKGLSLSTLSTSTSSNMNKFIPWTIAFGHHSVFSTGTHGDSDIFTRIYWDWFLEGRVDLFLSGHNHYLAHLQHGFVT